MNFDEILSSYSRGAFSFYYYKQRCAENPAVLPIHGKDWHATSTLLSFIRSKQRSLPLRTSVSTSYARALPAGRTTTKKNKTNKHNKTEQAQAWRAAFTTLFISLRAKRLAKLVAINSLRGHQNYRGLLLSYNRRSRKSAPCRTEISKTKLFVDLFYFTSLCLPPAHTVDDR